MLTIFSCPKPFRGHVGLIQRNAIRSWTLLTPRPEVILLGDDEGTAEVCAELGIRHIPEVQRNEYGTPLLSSIFEIGQSAAKHTLVCYVNADIILLSDFVETVRNVSAHFRDQRFLLSGRRWNIDMRQPLETSESDWAHNLKAHVRSHGEIDSYGAVDYFVFPKGSYTRIPPLALGRCEWDHWLLYEIVRSKLLLIDASNSIVAIHQRHDYTGCLLKKRGGAMFGPEVIQNRKLCEGKSRFYNLLEASHVLVDGTYITGAGFLRRILKHMYRGKIYVAYVLGEFLWPYSYPLLAVIRLFRTCRL